MADTVTSPRTTDTEPIPAPIKVRAATRKGSMSRAARQAAETGPLVVTSATVGTVLEVVDLGGFVWDRLTVDGENDAQYRAFQAFLGLAAWDDPAARRTLDAVGKVTKVNVQTLSHWAHRFHWLDRAAAHDDHQRDVARQTQDHLVRRVHEKKARLALKALDAAEIATVAGGRGYEDYAKQGGSKLAPDEAKDALTAAARLVKQIASEVAPPVQESHVAVDMGGSVDVNVAAELRALIAEIRPAPPGVDSGTAVVQRDGTADLGRPSLPVATGSDGEGAETAGGDG